MKRILHCAVCGKRFVAMRRDATTCSDRCRKKQSRTMAVASSVQVPVEELEPEPVVTLPVVTDRVTDPVMENLPVMGNGESAVSHVRTGWLPLAAVQLPPEPPPPPPKVMVPTRVDPMFGRLEDFVQCESPEAATHWDERSWHR